MNTTEYVTVMRCAGTVQVLSSRLDDPVVLQLGDDVHLPEEVLGQLDASADALDSLIAICCPQG